MPERAAETPFHILVVGDFSGRANRKVREPLAGRRLLGVDLDNVDDAIAELGTALHLPQATLRFREIDDFHPDHIYRKAEVFQKLEEMRDQPPRTPAPRRAVEMKPGRSLLDQMVEEVEPAESTAPATMATGDDLADFIDRVMAPHLERVDAGKQKWSAHVDAVAGEQMRAVLHHPDFQAVEALWRAVQMLVQRLDPDTELRIYLLDATLQEIMDDPREFAKLLAAAPEKWSLVVGNFNFAQTAKDAARLQILGRIASALGAPFVAEGQPPSDEDSDPEWMVLRRTVEARWIGLVMPRFLLRLPYGKETSEVEEISFEEMPQSVHTDYLWGNPAFACACLLGDAFREDGWSMTPGRGQLTGLPLHFYKDQGEAVAKPCAEILLSEHEAEYLMENGLMPLASLKDQDTAMLVRVQSIADPVMKLAGRWNSSR